MEFLIEIFSYIVANAQNLIGFALPPLVEVLNRDVKGKRERFLITVFICVLASVLIHWKELLYGTPNEVFTSFGIIFAESQVVFKLYFENSWIRWKMQIKTDEETIG